MLNFKQNEEAVSPVIGTILMVAITVILAAVIAAFVFGMTGNLDTNKQVAATASLSGTNVIITYQGGPDNADVTEITYTVQDSGDAPDATPADQDTITKDDGLKVGQKWSVDISAFKGENALVTVSAKFTDGTEQVILDTNLRVPETTP